MAFFGCRWNAGGYCSAEKHEAGNTTASMSFETRCVGSGQSAHLRPWREQRGTGGTGSR